MVRLNPGLESGSITMRLTVCLLLGLRLVSVSLCESLQRGPSLRESLGQLRSFNMASGQQEMIQDTAPALSKSSGRKRSLDRKRKLGESEAHDRHKRDTEKHSKPAHDRLPDDAAIVSSTPPSTSTSSTTLLQQEPSDSSNTPSSASTTSQSNSSSTSFPGSASNNDTSILAGNSSGNGVSVTSLPSSSSDTSSLQDSPSSSPSSGQDSPSSAPGALPNIDFGSINQNTSPDQSTNTAPFPSNGTSATTPATDGTVSMDSQQPSKPSHKKAIAAGVAVPISVIALGLVAMFLLRRQRQRRNKAQQVQSPNGSPNEEMAHLPAPQRPCTSTPAQQQTPDAEGSSNSGHVQPQPRPASAKGETEKNPFQRGSNEASIASRSPRASTQQTSVSFLPLPPVPTDASLEPTPGTSANVAAISPASASPPSTRSPKLGRGRSLKRKPVPALL